MGVTYLALLLRRHIAVLIFLRCKRLEMITIRKARYRLSGSSLVSQRGHQYPSTKWPIRELFAQRSAFE